MKDRKGIELEVGHICKVYPTKWMDRVKRYFHTGNMFLSQAQEPYYVEILPFEKSGVGYPKLMTNIPGKYGAWLHEDGWLLTRLEVVGTKDTHGHLLFNQFDDQELKIEEKPFELT